MKSLLRIVFLAGAVMSVGCTYPTPAYSTHERSQMIRRNWEYEWRQAQDDMDHALLLRPASSLTLWNVR